MLVLKFVVIAVVLQKKKVLNKMFKCAITGKLSQPGDKVNRIVTKTRAKEYFESRYNEDTDRYENVLVGRGWEIVEEVLATDEGVRIWNELKKNVAA